MSIEDLTGTIVRKICMACSREFAGAGGTCPHDGNMLVAMPQDPYVGRRISDKYHVLSVLGTGGMGVVYLARHETMQCNVALKMLRAQFVGDSLSVKRFTQEAIATRRLTHPNVITTYDHGFTPQGQPYIVMEVLEGKSLADDIKKLKNISVERVIHIFSQACDAIDHAHKQGIIHRDLKPGNIMLINYDDDPDFVKVVDFGVAKFMPSPNNGAGGVEVQTLTQAGEVCGSPVYMSPEQCLAQDLDRRADVYSMGVVIYEALTGKLPLLGKNMVETMSKHINDKPPSFKEVRPDLYIPEKVEAAVMRALQKRPDGRQPNMAVLKQELFFAVPRPGQNPNLRSIGNEASLPASETESKQSWVVPAIAAGVSAIAVAGAAAFYFGQKQAPPAVKADTPAQAQQAATLTPAQTSVPAAAVPSTAVPGTATPAQSVGSAVSQPAGVQSNSSATANTTRSAAESSHSAPVAAIESGRPKANSDESDREAVKKAKAVAKAVAKKHTPKIASSSKPAASTSKAASGSADDRFAGLLKMRSH